jgi:double-stranded uracil-DNA glycosylase
MPSDARPATRRPTAAELAAAKNRTIPDLVRPGLSVLFAGINPSLYSAAVGYHFARPGNRFWPTLYRSGFTARQLDPAEQEQILDLGLGITNVVARATARADELSDAELLDGGERLAAKVATFRPRWLAVVGVTAFRVAFGERQAAVGRQQRSLGATRVWVLPNPSGLNAHWNAATLAQEYGRLRVAANDP